LKFSQKECNTMSWITLFVMNAIVVMIKMCYLFVICVIFIAVMFIVILN